MTVTDQLEVIGNKINSSQTQYDLDRLAPKISAYSSSDLRKYEDLTGEDLGYKPGVVEQAKSGYFPLGQFFNKGLTDSAANKVSKAAKNESDFNYNPNYAFYRFYRDSESLVEWYH